VALVVQADTKDLRRCRNAEAEAHRRIDSRAPASIFVESEFQAAQPLASKELRVKVLTEGAYVNPAFVPKDNAWLLLMYTSEPKKS
jgi:hypothetical protein